MMNLRTVCKKMAKACVKLLEASKKPISPFQNSQLPGRYFNPGLVKKDANSWTSRKFFAPNEIPQKIRLTQKTTM
jgi:hypothetical protein